MTYSLNRSDANCTFIHRRTEGIDTKFVKRHFFIYQIMIIIYDVNKLTNK